MKNISQFDSHFTDLEDWLDDFYQPGLDYSYAKELYEAQNREYIAKKQATARRSAAEIAAELEEKSQRRKEYSKNKQAKRDKFSRERESLMLTMLKAGQPYECAYCGSKEKIQVDHIHPMSKGGSDCVENLQFLCAPCNQSKGDSLIEKPEASDEQLSLFEVVAPT